MQQTQCIVSNCLWSHTLSLHSSFLSLSFSSARARSQASLWSRCLSSISWSSCQTRTASTRCFKKHQTTHICLKKKQRQVKLSLWALMLGLAQRSDLSCDLSCANKSMTEPEIYLTNLALFLAMFIEGLSLTTQGFQCFRKIRLFSERKKKEDLFAQSVARGHVY